MADERKIVIELKAQDVNKSATDKTGNDDKTSTYNLNELIHPIKFIEKHTIGQNVLVNQAYQYTKAQLKQLITYNYTTYFSLTENYRAQQDVQNALTTIGKASSFGSSVISGAIIGAKAGPVGAAVGAIIASVGNVVNEGINIYQNKMEQKRSLIEADVEANFQLTRMGLTDGGRNSLN